MATSSLLLPVKRMNGISDSIPPPHESEEVDPIHSRHLIVGYDDIYAALADDVLGRAWGVTGDYVKAGGPEELLRQFQ